MSTDEYGEKTELPTERRRTEARDQGNVARSRDLTAAGLMLGAAIVISMLMVPLCRSLAGLTATLLRTAGRERLEPTDVVERFRTILERTVATLFVVSVPLTLGGAILSTQIMTTVFGPAYAAGGLSLVLLMLSVIVEILGAAANHAISKSAGS